MPGDRPSWLARLRRRWALVLAVLLFTLGAIFDLVTDFDRTASLALRIAGDLALWVGLLVLGFAFYQALRSENHG